MLPYHRHKKFSHPPGAILSLLGDYVEKLVEMLKTLTFFKFSLDILYNNIWYVFVQNDERYSEIFGKMEKTVENYVESVENVGIMWKNVEKL